MTMRVVRRDEEVRSFAREADRLFAEQRRRDRFGYPIHLWCAIVWCFFLSWPTTICEFALLPVLVCFAVRMTGQYRILIPLGWNWAAWITLALIGWTALSATWSAEPSRWLDDVGPMRYAGVLMLLWPVLDRRGVLIASLALGLLCGNLAQLVHAISVWTDHSAWLPWTRDPARLSGWWDPVIAGSLLCGSLGLHLGGVLHTTAKPRPRGLAALMCAVTVVCIMLTGTRGAMIGAAVLVVVAVVWQALSHRNSVRNTSESNAAARQRNSARAAIIGIAVVALCVNTLMLLPTVRERLIRGVSETAAGLNTQNYRSDTGARLLMWKQALNACTTHPLHGVGAGGYHAWAVRHIRDDGTTAERAALDEHARHEHGGGIHRHAHSWPLHTAATTGLIGVALTLGVILCTLVGGSHRTLVDAAASSAAFVRERGYALGPVLAALGLVLAGFFDSVAVNQQTAALWWTLVTLCLTWRPTPFFAYSPPRA